MESSPAAAVAPPPTPEPSPRARDPLLFGDFGDLPAGWGCRKPMGFCRDIGAPVAPEPDATAAVQAGNNGSRSPARGAPEAKHAPVPEEAREAPRRQWNLRERTTWRDYRAEDARPSKKLGSADAGGHSSRGFSVALTRQEIDADFIAITGRKPPRRPKKRTRSVQRQIETLCPGSSLMEVTRDRYKVNEKGGF
ncbi:unnamed protein product [Urochloa decumbens]|uniref:Uncharacterized protein n=1 Tax=Urochloa decumbens TaxID=240449 RepID=A0ABC8VPR5_9POAL